jgi:hypothetical protein
MKCSLPCSASIFGEETGKRELEKPSRIMTSPSQSLHTPLTFGSSTSHTSTLQPSNESFRLHAIEASPQKRPRGRPKGSTKKRPVVEDGQSFGELPKRPRGRPRKLEAVSTPKAPQGRPRKTANTEPLPVHERIPSNQIDIPMVSPAESMVGAAASTSGMPEFRRSSSAFCPVQSFSLGHDNAVGRWDVEQLVLNVTRSPDNQLAVKGSIRLGFRAQELSREERENLGQLLKAPLLQDNERINITFTGQATSQ